MGKWKKLRGRLPLLETDPQKTPWIREVDKIRVECTGALDQSVAAELVASKDVKRHLESELERCNMRIEAMARELIDRWIEEGQESIDFDGIGKLTISDEPYCSVQNRLEAIEWLKEQDLSHLVREDFNWKAMNGAIKERLEEGQELPGEQSGIKVYLKQTIKVTRKEN